jgi:hypothetical protein
MTRRTLVSAWLLGLLLLAVFVVVLITPSSQQGRPHSSYSAGTDGLKLGRDLIERLGWKPEARVIAFADTIRDPAPIQILVNANASATEAGALLEFVRRGGSLMVAGRGGAIDDSIALVSNQGGKIPENAYSENCSARGTWRAELTEVEHTAAIGWRRPLPTDTVGFGKVVIEESEGRPERIGRAAIGMPFGAGRLVAIADDAFLTNDVLRRCELETDVDFVRMIEYLSRGQSGVRVAFDEFHHGYGARGGSFTAIRMYLQGTPSGRMLAQIAAGGLLLLFAAAPRPLAPRDPKHVARRSPLEHADALAHAYAGVAATRTATARLLAGVRRRTRSRARSRDTDGAFLASAAALSPAASTAAAIVANALDARVGERDLPNVASALETIERELTRRPPSPTR